MAGSQQDLTAHLSSLSTAIAGVGTGVSAIAKTAEQAIPKSQMGTQPGDVVELDAQGRLPAVDGSLLTNLAQPHGILPVLQIELGNSAQANGGRGIDQGSWYQLDFRTGVQAFNDFQYTANSDGTITIPTGIYLVTGSAKIIAPSADNYSLPAQITFAVGQAYGYPGVYQNAVQRFPDSPTGGITTGGTMMLGSLMLSGIQAFGSNYPLWMGFSKTLGSTNQVPLSLQGYMALVKVG